VRRGGPCSESDAVVGKPEIEMEVAAVELPKHQPIDRRGIMWDRAP